MASSRPPKVALIADLQSIAGQKLYTADSIPVGAVARVLKANPLIVPPSQEALTYEDVLREADGVFLRGGLSNVHPSWYGKPDGWTSGPFDKARDAFVLPLIPKILQRGIPLLATCRGFHELNVALGGTLRQEPEDRPEEKKHGTPASAGTEDERYRIRQDLVLVKGGVLHHILKKDRVRVNSLHSQLIDQLAPGLEIEATAEDGTIEAARPVDCHGFALGLIFHPEFWAERDETSLAILKAFSEAVHAYARSRFGGAAETQKSELLLAESSIP
jgi:putative glutamine amidotransferase